MKPIIQGKQMDVGDALRTHVTEKIDETKSKYFNKIIEPSVTFSREGHGHGLYRCRISFRVGKNVHIVAEALEGEPYLAFNEANEKLGKQLRRYKNRLRDHNERQEAAVQVESLKVPDYTLAAHAEEETEDDASQGDPVVIADMTTEIETLTVSEAVMRMDLAGRDMFLFRNGGHGELNVVYRRPDGNIGWIDPSGQTAHIRPPKVVRG